MKFGDVFKKSFLEGGASVIPAGQVMATLCVVCLLSLYIFLIYRVMTRKSFYNKSFNVSLGILPVITSAIILAMQSNLVISLGMVGALSIVRFRTAVKDPLDLVFLFWSISIGIISGAGLYEVAFLACLVVTALIFVLENLPVGRAPMLLVVNLSAKSGEEELLELVKRFSRFYQVKSRNISGEDLDLVVEVRVRQEHEFVSRVSRMEQVRSVSLILHDGEATF